ncbi:hypothetical protein VTN77DRAFT_7387 [Rasamsonia byssochlamydoides]|uniref:uncharacterized protein n=1 Tax=Rasamsonia byssochlamydoides TaxID=89139 RepID=UPI0037431874
MPICIECSYPVSHLYTSYSKADDHSLGKGVRLTQCPRCKRFADKYVEHDYVVLFIDLVLIKPQVYRHLLFNRLGRDDNKFDRSIIRLGVLLLLFDVYLTWARIEKSSSLTSTPLSTAPIIVQYLFFLTLNGLATLAHHLTVRLLASILVPRPAQSPTTGDASTETGPSTPSTPVASTSNCNTAAATNSSCSPMKPSPSNNDILQRPPPPIPGNNSAPPQCWPPSNSPPLGQGQAPLRRASTAPTQVQPLPPPSPASPNAISTALFVSSCPKLFPILLVIWGSKESEVPEGGSSMADSPAATMLHKTLTATAVSPLSTSPTSAASLLPTLASSTATATATPTATASSVATFSLGGFAPFSWTSFDVDSLFSFLSLGAANTNLVLLNNIEALYILLDCGYLRAVALAVAGQLARWGVEKFMLGLFGIG